MVPCLVRESCVVINKEKEKTQGLRQHLGCKNGDSAGVSLAGSWQGEVTSSSVLPGITKAKLPTAREKKVLPASWASAQPEAAVYLAPVTSQHTSPCSWGLSVLQAGWDRGLATPVLPSALHKAAPHPPSGLTCAQEGIIHSYLHLAAGHAWDVSSTTFTKVSHPAGASNEARSIPFAPGRPVSSAMGTVYWKTLVEFGFTDVSSAA